MSMWTFLADIINKLSHRLHPDNSAVDEEEAKWRRYSFLIRICYVD